MSGEALELFGKLSRSVQRRVLDRASKIGLELVRGSGVRGFKSKAFPPAYRLPRRIRPLMARSLRVRTKAKRNQITSSLAVDYKRARTNKLANLIEWGWKVTAGFRLVRVAIRKFAAVRFNRKLRKYQAVQFWAWVNPRTGKESKTKFDPSKSKASFRRTRVGDAGSIKLRTQGRATGRRIDGLSIMTDAYSENRAQIPRTFGRALRSWIYAGILEAKNTTVGKGRRS